MTSLTDVKPKELAKVLTRLGFRFRPGKGSHVIFYNDSGQRLSLPMHTKPLGKGLLLKILKQVNVSREDFLRFIR